MPSFEASPDRQGHKRSRSAGVLKSIMNTGARSLSPKKGDNARSKPPLNDFPFDPSPRVKIRLPSDHRDPDQRVLGEIQNKNSSPRSPKKGLTYAKDLPDDQWNDPETPLSPAESAMLMPGGPPSPAWFQSRKEKENTTPPRSGSAEPFTPIWAQFTSQPIQPSSIRREEGMTAGRNVADEIARYPPKRHSPSKSQPENIMRPAASPLQRRSYHSPSKSGSIATDDNQTLHASRSPKKDNKVMAAVARLDGTSPAKPKEAQLEGPELDAAFEAVLVARNIPEVRRSTMRGLDAKIKRDFIKAEKTVSTPGANKDTSPTKSFFDSLRQPRGGNLERKREAAVADDQSFDDDQGQSPSKRSRSRTRTFSFGKRDRSSKRSRSGSRSRGLTLLKNLSSSSVNSMGTDGARDSKEDLTLSARPVPDDFIDYLQSSQQVEKIEVGRLHKLRLLLRNETVAWVDSFMSKGGMSTLVSLLRRIMKVEWRDEHEDMLLHETLLCLKGLCTTERALTELATAQATLFPELLKMLFDEERKGPSEYNTRGIIISLLFTHLAAASADQRATRAKQLLSYLSDQSPSEDARPAGFIAQMRRPRPYQEWCKEIKNVTKEVFWIFLHHFNVIATAPADGVGANTSYTARHFPRERPPVPAAPYVGGVEWEATNYLAAHLDLMNGLIASLPTRNERNHLRTELQASSFETIMGGTLRLCKEKFYGAVHDGLRTWISAAADDGWAVDDVRQGPPRPTTSDENRQSPKKGSPKKDAAPKLEVPQLNLGLGGSKDDEGWL